MSKADNHHLVSGRLGEAAGLHAELMGTRWNSEETQAWVEWFKLPSHSEELSTEIAFLQMHGVTCQPL